MMTARHWIMTAVLVVATAIVTRLYLPRYQIAVGGGDGVFAFKLDNWTGDTWFCAPYYRGLQWQCNRLSEPTDIDFDEMDRQLKEQKSQSVK